MTRRDPERLRLVASSALQRRVLDETAHEELPSELRERMARAVGVSAAAVVSAAALGKTAAVASKMAVGVGTGTTSLLPWFSVGVLGLVLAGAIVGAQVWKTSPSAHPAPAVKASVPEAVAESRPAAVAPPHVTAPGSSALAPPRPELSPTSAGRRLRSAPPPVDVREQTSLVDAARDAVASGAADRGLALVRQYQDRYPGGVYRPEVAALKIEALARLGRRTEVRMLVDRFVAEFGNGPLTDRVRHVAVWVHP
jgi:hypothetical protein